MSTSVTNRPATGSVNVHEHGDYPIILGESLKDNSPSRARYLQLRYNWTPRDGFQREKGSLTRSNNGIELSYSDAEQQRDYSYSGFSTVDSRSNDTKEPSRLILVFDESRSAFVLEQVSTSVDLNIKSATGHSTEALARQRQLPHASSAEDLSRKNGPKELYEDDDIADPSNRFDFRHFLAEARETAEKASQPNDGRTPMSVVASPSLNNNRFNVTTTLRPPSAVTTMPKKQGTEGKPLRQSSSSTKKPTANKRKEPATSRLAAQQPLSKERISDSDEELSEAATETARMGNTHTRNTSLASNASRSPPQVYPGGLEIIMDEPEEPRRRHKLDRAAFRSHTHTPTFGHSSNQTPMDRYAEDDAEMKEAAPSEAEDEDDDVEAFVLSDSPSHKSVEDPPPQDDVSTPGNGEDEDDDALKELLEAALDDDDTGGGGQNNWGQADDDESEISEEE